MADTKKQPIRRFALVDRVQHWSLVATFSTLALTGLVQKYSTSTIAVGIISLLGGIETVRIIHRIAAVLLMLEVVIHFGLVGYRLLVQRARPSIVPSLQDFRDALKSLRFNLGVGKEKPRYGRFSFEEKFEYWAVIWGLAVMILTGFMLWNPIATTHFLPGEFIPAAKSAHGNEALLAVLAILIWHLYNVLVRHLNTSMFTGKLSREEMLEFHPLELAEIEAGGRPREPESIIASRRRRYVPVFSVIAAVLLVGIFQFVTFEKTALDTVDPASQVTIYAPLTPQPSPSPSSSPGETGEQVPPGSQALALMWPSSAHTNSDSAAFRYWDAEGQVSQDCSLCHSSQGLPDFLSSGMTKAQPVSSGLFCTTCHNNTSEYTVFDISSVIFPSGAHSTGTADERNVCITCHVGVESGASLEGMLANLGDDAVDQSLEFVDIHGPAPGATYYGSEAEGAFQYADHTYKGLNHHTNIFDSCADCHSPHELEIKPEVCADCHSEFEVGQPLTSIRFTRTDYDGDGDTSEGIGDEILSLQEYLYAALQEYALESTGSGIVYDGQTAPYFFVDLNQNGVADPEEVDPQNRFSSWTPRLLKAAFNYHYAQEDRGAFAHNPTYMIQILYDSLENLGADVSNLIRP